MKRLKRAGLFKSIFVKFTIAFIAVGLLPLLFFSYISLDSFSRKMEAFSLHKIEQSVAYDSKNLAKVVSDYNNLTKNMYNYNSGKYGSLSDILKNSEILDRKEGFSVSQKETLMDVYTANTLYSDWYLSNVVFIDYVSGKVYSRSKDQSKLFNPDFDFHSLEGYDKVLSRERELTILTPHTESYYVRSDRRVVTFARNFLDIDGLPDKVILLGTIFLDVDLGLFEDVFKRTSPENSGEVYVVDVQGRCIYSRNAVDIGQKPDWFDRQNPSIRELNYSGYVLDEDEYYIFERVQDSDWIVLYRVNIREILKDVQDIGNFVSFIILACIAGLILVSLIFSNGFSLPLKRITRQMKKVESGNLDVSVEVKSSDEVGQLSAGFNNMLQELKGHIDKSYLAKIRQREAELTALKTQIRPHFLYNTLEVIRMSAVDAGDDKAADMIHSLSAQLKYMIGYSDDTVTLEQEIAMIRHYFKIIEVRYDGRIKLEVNIPEELLKLKILKLSLQPIVENAVIHGIRPKEGGGRVLITGEIREERLELCVYDDGTGMKAETADKIDRLLSGRKMGEETPEGWKSIGIKNVYDRLKMNFGEEYGLDVKSRENVGTIVKLIMPVMNGVDDKDDKAAAGG